jgi:hypothetical protein
MSDDNESTYKNIDKIDQVSLQDIENYWEQVVDIMKGSFQISESEARSRVSNIRQRLISSPPDTQLYFYHANPFQVASDLSRKNSPISLAEKEYYINNVRKLPENDRPHRESLQRLLPDDLIPRPQSA